MTILPNCKNLLLEPEGGTLFVTIDRPEARNALSDEVVEELSAVIDAIAHDRAIRAVVLRGAGGTFCAGADIKAFYQAFQTEAPETGESDPVALTNRTFGEFMLKLNGMPQTLVAVVEGAAFGGGFGLVCTSDIAIGMADAKFALSETTLGIPPAQIAPFVVQRIGITQARRLALSGARFTGEEAKDIGLLHFVAKDAAERDALLAKVLADIGRCAPGACVVTKQLLFNSMDGPSCAVLDWAADAFAHQLRSHEGKEGVMAFIEKRKPNWAENAQ
jgi:isohexenylglutaconyl-CoA hydratase